MIKSMPDDYRIFLSTFLDERHSIVDQISDAAELDAWLIKLRSAV